jgi:hypothetical protein
MWAEYDEAMADYERLLETVCSSMRHRTHSAKSACMKSGRCKDGFPFDFADATTWSGSDVYPKYRRRPPRDRADGDGKDWEHTYTDKKGNVSVVTNQEIVAHNQQLSLKYDCHINVQVCAGVRAVKYIYKYLHKGVDRICYRIEGTSRPASRDEVAKYTDGRVIGSSYAAWTLCKNDMYKRVPAVQSLDVHLENEPYTMWEQGNERSTAASGARDTTLTLWLKYLRQPESGDDACRQLSYIDFAASHLYTKPTGTVVGGWRVRKRGAKRSVGNMYTVAPNQGELFFLRVLLTHVTGVHLALADAPPGLRQHAYTFTAMRCDRPPPPPAPLRPPSYWTTTECALSSTRRFTGGR